MPTPANPHLRLLIDAAARLVHVRSVSDALCRSLAIGVLPARIRPQKSPSLAASPRPSMTPAATAELMVRADRPEPAAPSAPGSRLRSGPVAGIGSYTGSSTSLTSVLPDRLRRWVRGGRQKTLLAPDARPSTRCCRSPARRSGTGTSLAQGCLIVSKSSTSANHVSASFATLLERLKLRALVVYIRMPAAPGYPFVEVMPDWERLHRVTHD